MLTVDTQLDSCCCRL